MRHLLFACLLTTTFIACKDRNATRADLEITRDTVQAISLIGDTLFLSSPSARTLERYDSVRLAWVADQQNPDKLIWYGRWAAYSGDYKSAIQIFTKGIEQFPADARMYRHRGHRYITIRQFDKAIADLAYALTLVTGKPDEVEPDGQPNAQNIPVSTLQSNILYHLALAHYLKRDLEKAIPIYERAQREAVNDDQRVSVSHWLYMSLRILGKKEEAQKAVSAVHENMNIIENTSYQQLCLFYKGALSIDSLLSKQAGTSSNDAILYGLANWYSYEGQQEKAAEVYHRILSSSMWASFGYIAAEADRVNFQMPNMSN